MRTLMSLGLAVVLGVLGTDWWGPVTPPTTLPMHAANESSPWGAQVATAVLVEPVAEPLPRERADRAAPALLPPRLPRTFCVQLVDRGGAPLAGLAVGVGSDDASRAAHSDAAGLVCWRGLADGAPRLLDANWIVVGRGDVEPLPIWVLAPARELTVTVVDAGLQPVVGAHCTFVAERTLPAGCMPESWSATTSALGTVTLALPSHGGVVEVRATGHGHQSRGVEALFPEPCIVLTTEVVRRVHGRVLDERSAPIAEALVRSGEARTRSDAEGRFTLPVAALADHEVEAVARGIGIGRARVTAGRGDTELELVVAPTARRLAGQVLDRAANPLAEWTVQARLLEAAAGVDEARLQALATTVVAVDGTFSLPLPDDVGPIALSVFRGTASAHVGPFAGDEGHVRAVVDTAVASHELHGVIVATDGQPVAGAHVRVAPQAARAGAVVQMDGVRARTGSDGAFRLPAHVAGPCELWVSSPAGGSMVIPVHAASDALRITLPAMAVPVAIR